MGVYIENMRMPKGCATCPYCDRAWNKPKCKAKSMQGRFLEQILNLDRTRQKWCPLVHVPPHGDLIDRRKLPLAFIDITGLPTDRYLPVYLQEDVDDAPTIIESEGE